MVSPSGWPFGTGTNPRHGFRPHWLLAASCTLAIGLTLVFFLVVPSDPLRPSGASDATPVDVVRDLLDARISGDDAGLRAASCRADIAKGLVGVDIGAPIDHYTVDDVATGRVTGTTVSVTLTTATGDSSSARLPVIRENGEYRVCVSVASDVIP